MQKKQLKNTMSSNNEQYKLENPEMVKKIDEKDKENFEQVRRELEEIQNIEPGYARDLVAALQRRQPTFLRQLQDRYAKEVAAQREHLDWGCILKHTAELFHKHSQSPTNQP
jgi:hypothetical protein